MDQRNEIRQFLTTRRAMLTPPGRPARLWWAPAGARAAPGGGGAPGRVSVDYYTQMERGNLGGVSDSILHTLAGALQLDEAERAHHAEEAEERL